MSAFQDSKGQGIPAGILTDQQANTLISALQHILTVDYDLYETIQDQLMKKMYERPNPDIEAMENFEFSSDMQKRMGIVNKSSQQYFNLAYQVS